MKPAVIDVLSNPNLRLVLIDGDDTIWYDRRYFAKLRRKVLGEFPDDKRASVWSRLKVHIANAGAGEAAFARAILACGEEYCVAEGRRLVIEEAVAEFLNHPVELLPTAAAALSELRVHFKTVLYTQGIRSEQDNKIKRAGIGNLFSAVKIVETKDLNATRTILVEQALSGGNVAVIGNSLERDIEPVVRLGGGGIWLNHEENQNGRSGVIPFGTSEVANWDEVRVGLTALR